MKIKTTKKAVKDNYNKIISVGYCDLQSLLNYADPFGYSTRVEGWACDYYDVNGIAISTGYSPISKNTNKKYDLIREYSEKGNKNHYNYDIDYEKRKENAIQLLKEFVEKTIAA